jgi:hypothetical protein
LSVTLPGVLMSEAILDQADNALLPLIAAYIAKDTLGLQKQERFVSELLKQLGQVDFSRQPERAKTVLAMLNPLADAAVLQASKELARLHDSAVQRLPEDLRQKAKTVPLSKTRRF